MAEQLICNQQVVGSTPITSSTKVHICGLLYGSVPERPKGADCKSVVTDFGGPNPPAPTTKKALLSQDKSAFFVVGICTGGFVGIRDPNPIGFCRRFSAHALSKPLPIPAYCLRAFSRLDEKPLCKNCSAPIGETVLRDFSRRGRSPTGGRARPLRRKSTETVCREAVGFESLMPKPGASVCAQKVCRGQTF